MTSDIMYMDKLVYKTRKTGNEGATAPSILVSLGKNHRHQQGCGEVATHFPT